MKKIERCLTQLAGLVLWVIAISASLEGSDWKVGDIFVAVGGGQYKVYSNSGVFKETITDGAGNGLTAGCACDSTYHLYTTNFTDTKVFRYKIDHPHGVLQTTDTGVGSPGGLSESIVLDSQGNFCVGHVEGNGRVLKYDAAGNLLDTFAVAAENRGAGWIDLTADGKTLFYTSEGRLIKRFDVSVFGGVQLSDFAHLDGWGSSQVKLYALRLLPPGDGSGGLLVADKKDIKRLNGSGCVIKKYDAPYENDWQSLSLDPNGTSFWAGNAATRKFYRFNINTGVKELGPVATGSPSLSGICVYGGFSAAQAHPEPTQAFTATPGNPSGVFNLIDGTNKLTVTLNGLTQSVNLTARASVIDPAAGSSDDGLPCAKTAGLDLTNTPQKCVVWELEANPDLAFSSVDLKISEISSDMNTRFLRNEAQDITTFVKVADPGGTAKRFSIYSLNQASALSGATSGGYKPPVTDGAVFNLGRTLPFRFEVANCDPGTCLPKLIPRLSLVRLIPNGAPHPETVEVPGNSGTPPFYRHQGKTYKLEVSTKNLPPGVYIATTFDDSGQMPPFEVQFTLQ